MTRKTTGVLVFAVIISIITLGTTSALAHVSSTDSDKENTEVGPVGGLYQVLGQTHSDATQDPGPAAAPAPETSHVNGSAEDEQVTWSSAPDCNAFGNAGCHVYEPCEDGSAAMIFTLTGSQGEILSEYRQCPGDPAPTPETTQAPTPTLTPGRILKAFRRVPLPESTITVQPPGGETLVNFETVYSTEAEPFTETVRLLGRTVTLDITPATFTWHHGDGTTQTTDWAGRPWTEGMSQTQVVSELIHHVYTRKAKDLPVSVDTVWTARYRVNDGPWADVGGTVTMDGAAVALDILEARPVLTSG